MQTLMSILKDKTSSVTILAQWTESLVITLLFLAASLSLHDPLSLNSYFPWIWFAPILIVLRYGAWPALASILLLLVAYLYQDISPIFTTSFQLFILGGFLLTLVCAIFQGKWSKKITEMNEISTYLTKRTQSTADAYHVVLLAYQRLEQQYISRPATIRTSLSQLRELLARNSNEAIYDRFLSILSQQCSLEIAAIFPVKRNKILDEPISSIGIIKPPPKNDYLIQSAIEQSTTTYVKIKNITQGRFSNYLLAAPFLNEANAVDAILVVESMPFLSLNDENIRTLDLLIRYFCTGKTNLATANILKTYPECPVDFATELSRLTSLNKKSGLDSAVVAFGARATPHQDDLLFQILSVKRGLDTSWELTINQEKILLMLMPLTNRAGVESYKLRINEILDQEFNTQLNAELIKFKPAFISAFDNPCHLIQDLIHL